MVILYKNNDTFASHLFTETIRFFSFYWSTTILKKKCNISIIFQYEIIILTHSCHLSFIFFVLLWIIFCFAVVFRNCLYVFLFLVTAFHGIDFDWSWLSFNDVHLSHFVCHYHCGIHRHPSKLAFDTRKIRLDIRFAALSVDSEHILFWFRSHFSKELTLFKHCFVFCLFFFPNGRKFNLKLTKIWKPHPRMIIKRSSYDGSMLPSPLTSL